MSEDKKQVLLCNKHFDTNDEHLNIDTSLIFDTTKDSSIYSNCLTGEDYSKACDNMGTELLNYIKNNCPLVKCFLNNYGHYTVAYPLNTDSNTENEVTPIYTLKDLFSTLLAAPHMFNMSTIVTEMTKLLHGIEECSVCNYGVTCITTNKEGASFRDELISILHYIAVIKLQLFNPPLFK